ncbi:putative auto-transporter adhesin, head GIN domain [Arenibacter algicola]|uniref:Putative auto-transporter adhesin, head GIN domain n=1 Tax=Arenibacter algicola TaxID=616991 RepID=A0A221UWV0_9FLAO|nr:putative auto-transporter adhesin, head GIN domain [Arenibacter algicola]
MYYKSLGVRHILLFFMLLVGCLVYSQRKPKIKGNRNVIEVRETLPPFNAVQLDDDLDINLQAATSGEYIIEADDNLIDILKFKVENETLIISSYYRVTSKKRLNITVNFNELFLINANDGNIVVKNRFSTEFLEVNTRGSGRVEIDVDADAMQITMNDNSKGNFKVDSDTLNIRLAEKADLRLFGVMENTVLDMQRNSKADLEGFTDVFQFHLLDASDLKAKRLEANSVEANLEGSSSAEVLSTATVDLNSKGDSKTYVFGDSKINLLEFLDTSELYRRKN